MWADAKYPSCVGLSWIGGNWLTARHRSECWTDMKRRPWPLHLRFLPTSWVWFDSNGARLKILTKRK